jgi:CRISPR-associated endonuclease Cas2
MKQKEKQLSATAQILLYILSGVDMLPRPFENKTRYVKRIFKNETNIWPYYRALLRLEQKGWIRIYKEDENNYAQLTEKGKLEALFTKAKISPVQQWDGKWRMLIFDIPEDARGERRRLRSLLKAYGFKLVQQSVFINPYPLNKEAVTYLYETGLNKFIRIFRIDDVDNEDSIKKLFPEL